MVADMELVLEGCIDISPEALLGPTRHGTADPTVAVQSIEGADAVDAAADDNVDVNQQISVEVEAADSIAQAEAADIDMLDEDAPGEPDDGEPYGSVAPVAEITEETTSKPATEEPTTAAPASESPPAATEYPAAANQLPQPPTPPVSNPGAGSIISQDLPPTSGLPSVAPPGSFLACGGKPWYLENYDPRTRTFEEPPPPPPPAPVVAAVAAVAKEIEEEDAARATSDEELSEIDDEEMRDLEEGMDEDMGGKKVEKSTPKKAKAKKRRRAY